MVFVETPLSEQVLRIWQDNYHPKDTVQEDREIDINDPLFRMAFMKVDLGSEYLELACDDGTVIEYYQMERGSAIEGVRAYSESVKFRKGSIEDIISGDFFVRDMFSTGEGPEGLWVVEQGEKRPYDTPPLIYQRQKIDKTGFLRVEEMFITPYYNPKSQGVTVYSVSAKLEEVQQRWHNLKSSAENFGRGFTRRFVSVDADECDYLYMLTTIEGCHYLVDFGGKHFIDAAMSCPSLEEGLEKAYMEYQPRLMEQNRVETVGEALGKMKAKGKIALFTTSDFALQLLGKTEFDYDSFTGNKIKIGNREIRIGLQKEKIDSFMARFIDCLFCDTEYDILARWHDGNAAGFKEMIDRAEESNAVGAKEQRTGIKRKMQVTGLPLNELFTDKETEFFDTITEEINLFSAELKLLDEFRWWEDLSERLGWVLSEPFDYSSFIKSSSRQEGFRAAFVQSYTECAEELAGMDYSMFLKIDPERPPSRNGGKYGLRRRGIGNIMLDFGNRQLLEDVDFTRTDIERYLAGFYVVNRSRMTAHLFKGRILRPMLDRILPEEGVVAIDTCRDRVKELANFCEFTDRPYTLRYAGADLVLVNDEAKTALDDIRKKREADKKREENDILADLVRSAFDKAEEKDE